MDGKPKIVDNRCIWESEIIPNESNVYRQVHYSSFPKKGNGRRFPNDSCFVPDEDGLSVNWDKYCNPEQTSIIIGMSHSKSTGDFKKHKEFKILKLNAAMLRGIEGLQDVIHNPKYYGDPEPKGQPNNRSHSLVLYPDDVEIRLKICDWVGSNYDSSICVISDYRSIDSEIEKLRKRA